MVSFSLAYPKPLRPGARIGLIAPASPPREEAALVRGIDYLQAQGYKIVRERSTFERDAYLAGPDAERLRELNAMLRRDDIDALLCARGGYGTLRLLPHLDYEAARTHPKLLIGYSDITALHLAFLAKAGVPGLSGPMAAVEWGVMDSDVEAAFWTLAHGEAPDPLPSVTPSSLVPLKKGQAEGPLIGGNLAVLTRLIGTPYLPSLQGALLYLEDVGEVPYRLDALFAHLRLSGILHGLGGLILGGFTDWNPPGETVHGHPDRILAEVAENVPGPVAKGLAYGHFPRKNTLPVGTRARLLVEEGRVELGLLEPVVRESVL